MKKIISISILSIFLSISAVLVVPLTNYVITYEQWYSFMRLDVAILVLIFTYIVLILSLIGIVFLFTKTKYRKVKNI